MKYYIVLFVTLLCVMSCSTPRYISSASALKSEWVGRSHAEIIQRFGAPSREVSNGADGLILVYESFYTTHKTEEFMGDYTTTSRECRDFKEFYLRANGICYDVRTNETVRDGNKFSVAGTIGLATGCLLVTALILSR